MSEQTDRQTDQQTGKSVAFERISKALAYLQNPTDATEHAGIVDKNAQTAAVVLAGGSASRFGSKSGKQIIDLVGKPVLTWSLQAFDGVGDVGLIVIVAPEELQEEYKRIAVDPYNFVTPIVWANAGDTRQESAFSGLEEVPDTFEFVAMHDGARPHVSQRLVTHLINELKGNLDADGVILAVPAIDTLKMVEKGEVIGTPDRRVFWNAQTPQVFRTGMYRRAHAAALSDGFFGTDDSSLIERMGGHVFVVEGKRDNIKLTVPEDYLPLAMAVAALQVRPSDELTEDE